jgi:hypothetical protein
MSFYLAWIWLVVVSSIAHVFKADAEASGLRLPQLCQVSLYMGMYH